VSADKNRRQIGSESDLKAELAQLQIRIAGRLRLGPYSEFIRYGLRRDLSVPIEKPSAKIPIEVRPATDADLQSLLAIRSEDNQRERLEIAWRRAFVERGATGCFVAVDLRNNTSCYVHWLLGSSDNKFIQRLGWFPRLERHEAILENAYTPVQYRGLGIMSAAMAEIAERAADMGAYQVLAFVDERNVVSLKGCQRAGFHPYMLHRRVQMAFGLVNWNKFEEFSDDDPRRSLRF
jgi:RimJ/RimL family protein N-acetyltransferase